MGTGKQKLPEKSIGLQRIQKKERQLVPAGFEAIPYCETLRAEPAETAQIILRKGEWLMEIRNGADAALLREVLEILR